MTKVFKLLPLLLWVNITLAQGVQPVEPELETSYDNYEVLLMALAGLAILIALYFLRKRSAGRKNTAD